MENRYRRCKAVGDQCENFDASKVYNEKTFCACTGFFLWLIQKVSILEPTSKFTKVLKIRKVSKYN